MSLKIKICGICEPGNLIEISKLKPDLMGFIFYSHSTRYVAGRLDPEIIAEFLPGIRKAGVFVNADFEAITETSKKYLLDIVQLHGNESPALCCQLRETGIEVIKAFNIKEINDFRPYSEFIPYTNYLLFDSFTPDYGGSGNKFDWKILDKYDLGHPFFLSGGITPRDVNNIREITNPAFYGVDLNSRFEIKPGLKDIKILNKFISDIRLKY